MRYFLLTAVFCVGRLAWSDVLPGEITYNSHIRAILSNNCFDCHGPDSKARKASLRLDTEDGSRAATLSGSHPIVPGDTATSEVMARITSSNPDLVMPPPETGKTLSDRDRALIAKWIEDGAHYQPHWAFLPPVRDVVPASTGWDRNPIDAFVAATLSQEGIAPSPEANKATLIRRVYLDLIGLPPPPAAVAAFEADTSDQAYEKVVDELLASPHFGERWARHWLDAARYADSNGYSIDGPRSIWPYRDWVIKALNENMPFNQFIIEQLAGDMLPDATRDQIVATGFHRNTMINQEGGVDPEEFRLEAVFDRVNTTSTVFLGLTMACARCHTHKYDPIDHSEYYKLMAFFNSDNETTLDLPTPDQAAQQKEINARAAEVQAELDAYLAQAAAEKIPAWEASLTLGDVRTLPQELQGALYALPDSRSDDQKRRVRDHFIKNDAEAKAIVERIEVIRKELPAVPTTLTLAKRNEPRTTNVFLGGDFTRKSDEVSPGVPAVLAFDDSPLTTRLDLAHWLVDTRNPLTARVTVNRFWQRLFGRGIVETENDFGTQGALPTHPALLDWLAVDFMESGWDVKAMLRLICTSATYRQSSHARPDLDTVDPLNRLLARQNRLRLDAEIVRDNALAAAQLLNPAIGGPGVYPPQPPGVMDLGQVKRDWTVSEGADRYRRGMYTYFWRATPHPGLMVFDAPDAQFACTRRVRSNTPLQSLTLLNDDAYFECAQATAKYLISHAEEADADRIQRLYKQCLGRAADGDEVELLIAMLNRQRDRYAAAADAALAASSQSDNAIEGAAWTMVARAVMNLDEFITRE